MPTEYDLIVLGAGPVGENVTDYAHRGGLSTVIVESELVGGECSYWACMPSKTLLKSGAALRAAKALGGASGAITGELDAAGVLARRNTMVHDWNDQSQVDWLDSTGIDLVRGHGALTGVREVTVTAADGGTTVLTARHAVAVCTGSGALVPPIDGLAEAEPWTSREATSAQTVPGSLIVVGGGVVGCEMATAYAGFGSKVTMLSRSPLLGGDEPFAGELVADALRDLGADVRTDASPEKVERRADGTVQVTLSDGETIDADEILISTGRTPRTDALGLDIVGLEDGDWLAVDDTMLVVDGHGDPLGGRWLYAVGDVNHRVLLTHQGKYQARAAGEAIALRAKGEEVDTAPWGAQVATADHAAVPQVTFTDPEVASVGLTAKQAEKAGLRTTVVDLDLSGVAGAAIDSDSYVGRARMVVDDDRRVVVGMTFVGDDVGELIHSATIAVVGEVPIDRLWHAVPSYPTLSEAWLRLLESYGRPGS